MNGPEIDLLAGIIVLVEVNFSSDDIYVDTSKLGGRQPSASFLAWHGNLTGSEGGYVFWLLNLFAK